MENYKNTGLESHLIHQACDQQRLATSRGLQPAESCNQQRLATSRGLQPAEAYDQQCLATNRDRRELT
jgi:hypothetical protein